jgi:ankyrin repeat protein
MDAKELPARPSLEQYKKQAKDLLKTCKARDPEALHRVKKHHSRLSNLPDSAISSAKIALADAQFTIAREHGFESWPKFVKRIEELAAQVFLAGVTDPLAEFIEAAGVARDGGWHGSGTLDRANAILAAYPEVARSNIYTAAILGDDVAVRKFIARDVEAATAKGGPLGWDALTYLCFSRYLRLDKARSDGFVRTAKALLDAGANANTGWFEKNHQPEPEWESVLYGAAGVAHHAELTRLLLERGGDPNDGETPYHAPEAYDNSALKILVQSGKLNDDSLATILLRKTDWHDYEGIKWLLEHGVNPNLITRWGKPALHHAVLRDNDRKIIEVLLDHGADPAFVAENRKQAGHSLTGKSAFAMAARRGRRDLLELFEQRRFSVELQGVERLIAACARNDAAGIGLIVEREPQLVGELLEVGGTLLAEFAGTANTDGVRQLLDLGVPVNALYKEGDGYFDIAENSTALHVAAWKAWPAVVKLLLERGAPVNAIDGKGRTALALAVRACVDSYWSARRTPESVQALLEVGASVEGVKFPCGYAEVDELLHKYGKMG